MLGVAAAQWSPLLQRSAVSHVPLQSVHTVSDLILWLPGSARKNLLNDIELLHYLHSNICDANLWLCFVD